MAFLRQCLQEVRLRGRDADLLLPALELDNVSMQGSLGISAGPPLAVRPSNGSKLPASESVRRKAETLSYEEITFSDIVAEQILGLAAR